MRMTGLLLATFIALGAVTKAQAEPKITPIILTGEAVPEDENFVFEQLNQPEIGEDGTVVFRALSKQRGTYSNNLSDGLFQFENGELTTFFDHESEGLRVEGKKSVSVAPYIQMLDNGDVMLRVETFDHNDTFVGRPGRFASLFNGRDGLPPDVAALGKTSLYEIDVAGGQMIFTSYCYHVSALGCREALYHWDGASLREIVPLFDIFDLLEHDQQVLQYDVYGRVNRSGQVLVSVKHLSNEETGGGLYLVDGENWTPLFEEPVGTDILPLLHRRPDTLALNDDGQALFVLTDTHDRDTPGDVLYQSDGATIRPVVALDALPRPEGWAGSFVNDLCVNNTGTIAFTATLVRPDPDDPRNNIYGSAFYAMKAGGEAELLYATGDVLELADTGSLTVSRINSVTDRECALNDRDEVATGMRFDNDVSGLFLLQL